MMKIVTPAELGLANIDLKAAATTVSSLNFDALDGFQFTAAIKKTLSAGVATTGLATVGMNVYRDKAKTDFIYSTFLATSLDMKVGTLAEGDAAPLVTWGGSGGEALNGTLRSGAGANRIIPFIELFFVVTEVVDIVATATGDVYLLVEGFNR
jgi:hypothetical protein